MTDLPADAPCPKLCHILQWPDFDGYGFNLHADKSRPGQYIGKIDSESPADVSGLREGDRIIEVNGINICNENHKQVVQRIKAVLNETRLLVVDSDTDKWYKEHNILVRGDQENIQYGTSQKKTPSSGGSTPSLTPSSEKARKVANHVNDVDANSVASVASSQSEGSTQHQHGTEIRDLPAEESSSLKGQEEEDPKDVSVPGDVTEKESDHSSLDHTNVDPVDLPEPDYESGISGSVVTSEHDHSLLEYDNIRFESEEGPDSDLKRSLKNDSDSDRESDSVSTNHNDIPAKDVPDHDVVPDNTTLDSHSMSSHSSKSIQETTNGDRVDEGSTDTLPETESDGRKSPMSVTPSPPPPTTTPDEHPGIDRPAPPKQNSSLSTTNGVLNLNMTAAEMRAHLATRKKFDPRKDTIDLKKKYQIIQNM